MKTNIEARSAGLAGLFLLVAILLLTVTQVANAGSNYPSYQDKSTAAGSVKLPPAQVLNRIHPTQNDDVGSAAVTTRGPGEAAVKPVVAAPYVVSQAAPSRFSLANSGAGSGTATTGFSTSSSGSSSTSIIIALAALSGGLAIVLWAFARGRIRRREPSFDCEATLLGC